MRLTFNYNGTAAANLIGSFLWLAASHGFIGYFHTDGVLGAFLILIGYAWLLSAIVVWTGRDGQRSPA